MTSLADYWKVVEAIMSPATLRYLLTKTTKRWSSEQQIQDERQVKTPQELRVGDTYLLFYPDGHRGTKYVIKEVDTTKNILVADAFSANGKIRIYEVRPLSEYGLVPSEGMYRNGTYLVPEEKKEATVQ